jgi:protein-L-isoaspartate O-methyltransferase
MRILGLGVLSAVLMVLRDRPRQSYTPHPPNRHSYTDRILQIDTVIPTASLHFSHAPSISAPLKYKEGRYPTIVTVTAGFKV